MKPIKPIPEIQEMFIKRTDWAYNKYQSCVVMRVEFCDGAIWEHQIHIKEIEGFIKRNNIGKINIETT